MTDHKIWSSSWSKASTVCQTLSPWQLQNHLICQQELSFMNFNHGNNFSLWKWLIDSHTNSVRHVKIYHQLSKNHRLVLDVLKWIPPHAQTANCENHRCNRHYQKAPEQHWSAQSVQNLYLLQRIDSFGDLFPDKHPVDPYSFIALTNHICFVL